MTQHKKRFAGISASSRKTKVLLAGAAAVALVGGSAGIASAVTSTPTPAPLTGTIYACVSNTGQIAWLEMSNPGHTCADSLNLEHWSVQGLQGVSVTKGSVNNGDLVLTFSNGTSTDVGHVVGAAGASATPVTASAQTDITNDADSGNHGDWAVDTLTRQMTVTRHGAVAVSNCGGTATNGITSCYYYTALMTDTGSFTTNPGASSPNAGTTIKGVLSGTISGGSSFEFYSSSGTPNSGLVPASLDAGTNGTDSSVWPERFFAAGTNFGDVNEINWSYTYNAPTTCETWTDAFNNGDGGQSGDGDITGVNACTAG
jgi:hypothetical protein